MPPDEAYSCDFTEFYPAEVTFTGNDCFANEQEQAFFTDQMIVDGSNKVIIRSWQTTDICGNLSEPQMQTITFNCEPDCTPPAVGTFDCDN